MRKILEIVKPQEGDYFVYPEGYSYGTKIEGMDCFSFEKIEQEERGTFVVIVAPILEDENSIEKLESLGLENQKDFFVIPRLLAGPQGGYWA
jgi:hypothetical protein